MEWFFGLLLLWSFFEARSLSSQSQFDNLSAWWHILTALSDNTLHVASFRADQTASNLKLLLIWDLDVVPASVFDGAITAAIRTTIPIDTHGLLMLGLVAWNDPI